MPSPDLPAPAAPAVPTAPALWLLRVPDLWSADTATVGASVLVGALAAVRAVADDELDAEELARADAFVRDLDRVRYLAAHVALRRVLAAATGTRPRDLVLVREPCPCCGALHGRPALAGAPGSPGALGGSAPLHFSLSHGGDLVLIGTAGVPIGVDVEALPEERAAGDLVSVLHPGEQAELAALAADRLPPAFARIWTRKEAYLKGLGTGLGRDPGADYLGTTGLAPAPPGWTVTDIDVSTGPDLGPGHAAAVALRGGPDPATPLAHRVPNRLPHRLPAGFVLRPNGL